MAPTAKAPRPGPHQPQRASAVVGAATVATPIVAAAATAVRVFLMASPQSWSRGVAVNVTLDRWFHADAERGLNGCLRLPECRHHMRTLSLHCRIRQPLVLSRAPRILLTSHPH